MPAPKGHPLWGNPIKPKLYTPEGLWDKFVEYIDWSDANPIVSEDFIKGGMAAGEKVLVNHSRAYSIERFCVFANMSDDTFSNYEKKEGYETYFGVCKRIRKIIDSQHFEGGMAGVFNANITTRKLGLKEQNELSGSIGITWNEQKTYDSEQETDDHN